MMAFDPRKPVRTRGDKANPSKPVRILATDLPGDYPIGGHIDGFANLDRWTVDGRMFAMKDTGYDLINVPERHVRWVNIYREGGAGEHDTREAADGAARDGTLTRIACIRIEFEEGEGLETDRAVDGERQQALAREP